MSINEDSPLMANPDIVFREEEEGAFLFDPDTGELKCLNPLGSAVWKLLGGSNSQKEIESLILKRYPGIPLPTVHRDVASFLQELIDMGYAGYQTGREGK